MQNVNKPFRECLDMYKSRSPSNQLASSFFVHDGSEPTLSGDATPVLQSPQYRNTYYPVTNQRPDLSIGPRDSGDFCSGYSVCHFQVFNLWTQTLLFIFLRFFSVSRSRLYCDRMVTERFKYLLRDHCELCAAKFKTIKNH